MSGVGEGSELEAPIVVGYNGDDESERALSFAFEEARLRQAPVVVLVVAALPYEWVDEYGPGVPVVPGPVAPIPPEGPPEIQPLLTYARRRLQDAGIRGTAVWGLGDPISEIIRIADEQQARAIVVGTHHHSALGRFLGTDTAAEIVRESHCEVLVAR